jgi:histidine triad (HIT) family protein
LRTLNKQKKNCIFCKIIGRKIPVQLEYEDNAVVAFCDKNPQAPVHILVVPKTHISKVTAAGRRSANLLGQMLTAVKHIAAKKKISGAGYRVVINCGRDGGQLIEHVHMHLLGGRSLGWPPG